MALQDFINRWTKSIDYGQEELAPYLRLTTIGGDEIDWVGLNSLKMRLQLGSADELEIDIMARDNDGNWRPDMGIWQKGAGLYVELGYDGDTAAMQQFQIVSHTVRYQESGPESMTIRGVSDLARALHNKDARVFDEADDNAVIDAICQTYGWQNGVDATLKSPRKRIKKKGVTDLEMLRTISKDALIGGPTVDVWGMLLMPEPKVGPQVYCRGPAVTSGARRLISFSPSREGGGETIQLKITAWDAKQNKFIETIYQADEFSDDPEIVYEGTAAVQSIGGDSSSRNMLLQVISVRGHGEDEKRDVISAGRFIDEDSTSDLAKRWFELRERAGRWANLTVPGHSSLVPYVAVTVEGELAEMDKGIWLPTVVEHTVDDDGWNARLTAIRVVQETTVSPVS